MGAQWLETMAAEHFRERPVGGKLKAPLCIPCKFHFARNDLCHNKTPESQWNRVRITLDPVRYNGTTKCLPKVCYSAREIFH